MAADLEDLRAKITTEAMLVLEAVAEARGTDTSSIVREILDKWAADRIKIADAIAKRIAFPITEASQRPKRIALTNSAREAVYARDGGTCVYCRMFLDRNGGHVDHVVPVCQGGTNDLDNLVLACSACNLQKAGRTVSQWRGDNHG